MNPAPARPPGTRDAGSGAPRAWLAAASFSLVALVYLVHLGVVARHAVDVPFWDEWEMLNEGGLSRSLELGWVLERHNEHRIVPTRLATWIGYRLDGWNLAHQQIANFVVFGALLAATALAMRRAAPALEPAWRAAFVVLLLSGASRQNHAWGFQSQFHFFLLFFVLGSLLLFDPRRRLRDQALGALCLVGSAYSFSAGVVCAIVALVGHAAFALSHPRAGRAELARTLGVVLPASAATGLWFVGYASVEGHPALRGPGDLEFWRWLLDMLALGFGYTRSSSLLGLACLALVAAPCLALARQRAERSDPGAWLLATLVAGLLGALASIASGRSGFALLQAKSSRYVEIAMLMVPLAACAWHRRLAHRRVARPAALAALWLVAAAGHLDDWDLDRGYLDIAAEKRVGLRCLETLYERAAAEPRSLRNAPRCPYIYPAPLERRLARARALRVSFYRRIEERRAAPETRGAPGAPRRLGYPGSEPHAPPGAGAALWEER